MKENLIPSAIADNKGMTSLEIAEVTGKEHFNVMRDIRNILEQGVSQINFELAKYKDKQGKPRDMFSLTPKGCLILASGYDALLRERIINRLEQLEKSNKPQLPTTYLEALESLVASEKEKLALLEDNERKQQQIAQKDGEIVSLSTTITQMKPKVSYVDAILQCKDTVTITAIAQDYGKSAKAFNVLLRNFGIQRKVGSQWILYAKYLACGYVQSETFPILHKDGTQGAKMNTR